MARPAADEVVEDEAAHRVGAVVLVAGLSSRMAPASKLLMNLGDRPPGTPNWHLAPLSMAWENLSQGELCRAHSTSRNGNKDLKAIDHMTRLPHYRCRLKSN
ncbi:MAG: hypothetical protein ACREX9_05505 [Gammaproteobacteria bacterium]